MSAAIKTTPAKGWPLLMKGLVQGVPPPAQEPPWTALSEDGRPASRVWLARSLVTCRAKILTDRCWIPPPRVGPCPRQLTRTLADTCRKTKMVPGFILPSSLGRHIPHGLAQSDGKARFFDNSKPSIKTRLGRRTAAIMIGTGLPS